MSQSKFASNRRVFMMQAAVGAGAVFALNNASAADVVESDPQAVALGYKADATKVDKTKQPKYAAGQMCGSCALYQGKAGAASGPCPLFGGKDVSAKGWCSAYVKKA
jgi:High potential iron-sulfur protein